MQTRSGNDIGSLLRVERAFFLAGAALRQLRDHRLYRDTHPDDFIGYCRDRFGKTKQAVNYLIAAAGVYENLATTIGCREDETRATTESTPILPTSERQVRSLAGLEPEKQQEIWLQAVDEADGKAKQWADRQRHCRAAEGKALV